MLHRCQPRRAILQMSLTSLLFTLLNFVSATRAFRGDVRLLLCGLRWSMWRCEKDEKNRQRKVNVPEG